MHKFYMLMKKYVVVLFFIFVGFYGCKEKSTEPAYSMPSSAAGRVTNPEGAAVADAFVSLADDVSYIGKFTDANGYFRLDSLPAVKHKLKVERLGYELYEAEIPSAINGIATVNPVLKRKDLSVPAVKPQSTGMVRIRNKKLEVDFDKDGNYEQFLIKGAAYSPAPICSKPVDLAVHSRALQYLKTMNANTIRTYSGADAQMMKLFAENNIRVIVSYWVDYNLDLSKSDTRQQVKNNFVKLVQSLKDSPALLIWNLGNEQNYQNGNNIYWYTLAQELAVLAYQVEGINYHPVMCSNGAFNNIGSASFNADDASLTYIDAWATNNYEMDFTNSLAAYRTKSAKPIVFTEFGIDALDNRTKTLYETVQMVHDSLNWQQILRASDVCLGGTVFEFTDEWWKSGDACTHDYGGYSTGAHEDGYSNEEWWGVIAVTPDSNSDGIDEWRPRPVFYMFQRNWK